MNKNKLKEPLILISLMCHNGRETKLIKYKFLEPQSELNKIKENKYDIQYNLNNLIELKPTMKYQGYANYLKDYPEFLKIVDELKVEMQNMEDENHSVDLSIHILENYYDSDTDAEKTKYLFNVINIDYIYDGFSVYDLIVLNLSKEDFKHLSDLKPIEVLSDDINKMLETMDSLNYPDFLKPIFKEYDIDDPCKYFYILKTIAIQ